MADSSESKTHFQTLSILAPKLIAFFFMLVIHLFIIVNNANDWWKGRSVTSVDHIVTSLGVSRLCAECVSTLFLLLNTLLRQSPVSLGILFWVYDFFFYSNIWLTSLLSIVYCLKISNLRTRLFLYLRRVILPRTGHFIVSCGNLALVSFVIVLWMALFEVPKDETYNITLKTQVTGCISVNSVIPFTIGTSIPLIFYFISSVLLFASLYLHTVKMKMSSNLSINLETYYSAMKFISVTFIFNATFFAGYVICVFYYNFHCEILSWVYIALDFLPSIHSSYLIYTTAKLRSQITKILQNVIDVILQKRGAETRTSSRR
ncbi:taste receptor type 2 member 13-like [Dendrobates tinctorius]|uniref:taste receptor type 2 member 13-like n=1 Tax=Dendrobates tinctorius TaxID=92724 RepID=UPI003CC93BFB